MFISNYFYTLFNSFEIVDELEGKFKPNPNSLKNTFCVFYERELSEIKDKKPDFKSDSGSAYYYTEFGMYRLSNHWGRLANSKWRLVSMGETNASKVKLGLANWTDFYPDNATDLLYYLDFDSTKNEIVYQHKNNPTYDGKAILRTSAATMKRIKTARNILTLSNWAKYFDHWDVEEVRAIILNELIHTNKTIEQIKRELYESE